MSEDNNINELPTSGEYLHWKRNVTLFLSSQTVSLFGSAIVQYAVMWHLTLTTKSGWIITLYTVAAFLPQALISLFGGALADRINRRTVIAVADSVIALVTLGLALTMSLTEVSLWLILLAVAIRSVGQGFQSPAVSALVTQITPPMQLMRVNGINQTLQSSMQILAPVVAGAIYGIAGLVPTFWVDVVTALVGVGILLTIPVPTVRSAKATDSSMISDLKAGIRYVRHKHKIAWLVVLYAVLFPLVVAPPAFLTPLMLARAFSDEVWLLTANELVFSVGMLLGGLCIATFATNWHQGRMLKISCFTFAAIPALIGLTPLLGYRAGLTAFFILMALLAISVPFFSAPVNTLIQRNVDQEYMGRVMSIIHVVVTLGMPFGMVVFGPLADVVSVQLIMIITGVIALVFEFIAFAAPAGREVTKDSGSAKD